MPFIGWREDGYRKVPPIGRTNHYFFLAFFLTSLGIGMSYLDNCSSFATGIWNEISSVNLNAGFPKTPASLVESIKSKSGYETNRTIQYNTNIGYVQNGNFVSVVLANNRRNVNVVQFVEPINLNPNSFEI